VDRQAVEKIAREWLDALADGVSDLAWLKTAQLTAYPAFLVAAATKEGDDYKAGAVPLAIDSGVAPSAELVDKIHDAVVDDRSLGGRAKWAVYERPSGSDAGTLVIVPR